MNANPSHKLILALETSCDETAAALVKFENGQVSVISNIVSSQIDLHQKFGGVVPELAAREHVKNILPVIKQCFNEANIDINEAKDQIDAIAIANGPGLITSLVVGIETAKTLSLAWNKPLIPVNHIEGHIFANYISNSNIILPAITLTVSGGHTNLVLIDESKKLSIVGQTRDDAAGEAFDKAAQLMNIGYPGGPIMSKKAEEFTNKNITSTINLPRPMLESGNLDFSFSGLKTALLYQLQKDSDWRNKIPEYCAEFQQAIIDVLISKTIKAAKKHQVTTVMLAGGVSANKELRSQLAAACQKHGFSFFMPELKYTTDNAAMIGAAACFKDSKPYNEVLAQPNQEI